MKHNWQYKKLGEICEILMGQSPSSESYNTKENGFPFFQGCADFGKINPEVTKYCSKPIRIANENDILFSVRAPIGSMNIANLQCCIGRGLCSLRICKPNLQQYLFYALTVTKSKIIEKGTGSTFKAVGKDVLFKHSIPLPPREVQQRIVAELDRINGVMEDCRQLLRTLDDLAQSLFYDSFGDPISNPKAWPTCKVSDNFETGSGGTPSKSNANFWNSPDIPWVGSNMCQNTILHKTDGKFISNLGLQNSSAKLLSPDTLLVALVGATIGKVALLKIPTSTNQNIGFIKPNKDIANPIFMFYTLQGLYPLFIGIGNGNFKMANLSFIRNLPIILPPLPLQQQFARRIEAIEAQKKAVEQTIATLQTLLDSRMDYWFN
ncbi:MAG: restriction endonuclease subunit S [Muribaculaceae bacterium]